MARCYVWADDAAAATEMVTHALERDKFDVVEVEWCVSDTDTEWETAEHQEAAELIAKAEQTGSVVYGRFDVWPPEVRE